MDLLEHNRLQSFAMIPLTAIELLGNRAPTQHRAKFGNLGRQRRRAPPSGAVEAPPADADRPPDEPADADRFGAIADALCKCAPHILQHCPEDKAALESHVIWLHLQHGHYKNPHAKKVQRFIGKSGKRYEPDILINSLLLAKFVTNDRDLSEALKLSLRSACSRTMADFDIGQVENAKSILSMPSASTISRRRLMLDVSFMMIMQKVN